MDSLIRLFFDRGGSFHPKRDALVSSKYTNVIASTKWRSNLREVDYSTYLGTVTRQVARLSMVLHLEGSRDAITFAEESRAG